MYIGSHVSISKGYLNAAISAHKIGAKAFQYFPKNPRSLSVKKIVKKDAENCKKFSLEHNLLSIAHTPYPTNLAVEEPGKREMMLKSVINDLEIADACGSIGVVVHFGIYRGKNMLAGYQQIISLLNEILLSWEGDALLLLENQAMLMGTTFEELVQVRNLSANREKIGFCFDTCHAFASGLWKGNNWLEVYEKGMALDYFTHVKAIHLNDSKYQTGSFRDRHANIGEGHIGIENLQQFLAAPFLTQIPVILETPQSSSITHKEELAAIAKYYP